MGEITEALRRARQARAREDHAAGALADSEQATIPTELPPRERGAYPPGASRALPPCSAEETIVPISRAKVGDWVARAVVIDATDHPIAECFRQFAVRVRPAIEARSNPTLMVTSALRREGKTTVACNLALALASMAGERRVALVDFDLHRPGVARALGIFPAVGLERVLDGQVPLGSARICTDVPALDVFSILRPRSQAHQVFSSRRFQDVATELANGYDAVVIDTPPTLLLPDVSLIAPHVGGWIAVVRAGNTPRSAFREMLDALAHARLIGCFLNDATLPRHTRYGYHQGDLDDEAENDSAGEAASDARA